MKAAPAAKGLWGWAWAVGAGAARTSRALGEHWPEVLSLWTGVSHRQMELERGEQHPQGALGWGESLEPPPSPLTSPC